MQPGRELERVAFPVFFGWLFKDRVRALALHEAGLVIERGSGNTFAPWSTVERILGGATEPATGDDDEPRPVYDFFELELGSGERVRIDGDAGRRVAGTIAERAGLEWFELAKRRLPPMAVRPEIAAKLRASFSTWSE